MSSTQREPTEESTAEASARPDVARNREAHRLRVTRETERVRLQITKMAIESGITLTQIARAACKLSAETLNVARVGIWVLVQDRTALKCLQLYEANRKSWSEGAVLQVADFPVYFASLEQRKIVPVECAQSDPRTSELLESYLVPLGITSLLDAPIYIAGQVIGVVCCESTGPEREWSTEERDFVASISDLLAVKYRAAQIKKLKRTLEWSETRLIAMEKSEALAKLALGVAHDFRNILVSISNSVFVLKSAKDLPEALREPIRLIEQATQTGTGLVSEMIDYGRNHQTKPHALHPAAEVDRFLPMLRTAISSTHELRIEHSNFSGKVFLDRNQFQRVLLNLVLNARDASQPGSLIEIRTGVITEDECADSEHAGLDSTAPSTEPVIVPDASLGSRNEVSTDIDAASPDISAQGLHRTEYIVLEVRDQGSGMDESTRERLFEPYFSTKASGVGLGMAIVDRIVSRAGGFIQVDSEPGKGTTVRVHLPRVSVSD